MKIVIGGDFSPQNRFEVQIQNSQYQDSLKELRHAFDGAEFKIVNFETTIVPTGAKPIIKIGPNLSSSAGTIDVLSWLGVNIVTLANNHTFDYGKDALNNSMELLSTQGISCVGAGENLEQASEPLFVKSQEGETLAIINCCEHEYGIATERNPGTNPLNPVRQYYDIQKARKKADYVLVIVHGGHEQFPLPSLRMQDTYRFFIDAGADIVVNNHQHCYSGREIYNGKPIYYGLGNLVFDWKKPFPPRWNEGILLKLELKGGTIKHIPIPYTQFGNEARFSLSRQKANFEEEFKRLSEIISNRDNLREEIDKYYAECQRTIYTRLQPWPGKYFKGAFFRGWLPSHIPHKTLNWIKNVVLCQSHCDKLEYFLENKLPLQNENE